MRFAVLGDPVGHSRSPRMHAAAYRALGMAHTYDAIRAKPEDLARLVAELRAGAFDGFNVTVPHKMRILEHVDVVDASAAVAGAANTLVRRDGKILAHNTDAPALGVELLNLARARGMGATAVILGSGGAARSAIVAVAANLGVSHVVVRARLYASPDARRVALAELRGLLASAGSRATLTLEPLAASPTTEREALFVVQATSAGMEGADPGDVAANAVAWDALPANAVALDVVYAPPETPFLKSASARGLRCANGVGMLARQGALAFELWLGVPAPYDAMVAALG